MTCRDLRVLGTGYRRGECPRIGRVDEQVRRGGDDEGRDRQGGKIGGGVDGFDQGRLSAGAAGYRGGGLADHLVDGLSRKTVDEVGGEPGEQDQSGEGFVRAPIEEILPGPYGRP